MRILHLLHAENIIQIFSFLMLDLCISVTYIISVTVYIYHFCSTQVRAVDTDKMSARALEGSFRRSGKSNQTRHAQ